METLTDNTPGGVEEKLSELRGSMVEITDTLGDKLHTLEDMAFPVSTMVEEAIAKLANGMEDHKYDQWSDRDTLHDQGFQMMPNRVSQLEARHPPVTGAYMQLLWSRAREHGDDNPTVSSPRTPPEMHRKLGPSWRGLQT